VQRPGAVAPGRADPLVPVAVAYFFEHPSVSGAEGSALDLLAHVDREEFALEAYAPAEGELASRLAERRIPLRPWRVPRSPREEQALIERLHGRRFAVLHANTIELGRLTGRIAGTCEAAGVAHIRSFGSLSARSRRNLCGNEALIAVSRAVRDHLVDEGIPPEKVRLIYNGVSMPVREDGADIRAELGLERDAPVVVWIGQITVRKGPDVFIDVAQRCAATLPDLHFVLLGDVFGAKEENMALKELIVKEAGSPPLAGHFHFLGWRRDAFAILSQSTVLVHTARQEPLSRVLIEALAAGCPSVVTAVGGTPEVVGDCAVLAHAGDVETMARAVTALVKDAPRRRVLACEGRKRWQAHFQAYRMAREVEDLWRELACARGGA
jgi:glycosyltransferase involved in cell wall biosynthesis